MKTLKITEIRQVAKDNEWPDSWWYLIDGTVSDEPIKIGKAPRENTVLVQNEQDAGKAWIRFRYPGYITPEELEDKAEKERQQAEAERLRKIPTEKQKVALEFFGKNSENVTRQQASELLDGFFDEN